MVRLKFRSLDDEMVLSQVCSRLSVPRPKSLANSASICTDLQSLKLSEVRIVVSEAQKAEPL